GELFAVTPAVLGLGQVLGDEGVRQVAVDALGRRVVARLLPSVVLALHDVAVRARGRVGAEGGQPLRVAKGIRAEPDGSAEADARRQEERAARRLREAWFPRGRRHGERLCNDEAARRIRGLGPADAASRDPSRASLAQARTACRVTPPDPKTRGGATRA